MMNKTFKTLLSGLIVAGLSLMAVPAVEGASIRVIDVASSTVLIINDNDANDLVGVTGVVAHSGTIGDFLVDFELGVTKPVVGSPAAPVMALTIGATSGLTGGTLVIDFSETGFGPTGSGGSLALATGLGVSAGNVVYETYYDAGDALFGGTLLTSDGPTGPGAIVFNQTGSLLTTPTFSLTQRLIIAQGPGGTTSLGSVQPVLLALAPVPDGGWAVGLLGFALMGVEGLRRKYTRL